MVRLNRAQSLALNIDAHIAIDAGAGTGKTTTIVRRLIQHYLSTEQRATRILPTPSRPSKLYGGMVTSTIPERIDPSSWGGLLPGEVVLLTFTNSAAEDLKEKIRKELSELHSGPISEGKSRRGDPRIANKGTVENLQTLIEDAPIGTIDSFFNRLIAPYLSILGDDVTREIASGPEKVLLEDLAFNTLWRLPNSTSRIGDAVDAGIPSKIATQVLDARDRISVLYPGIKASSSVLRTLINNSVFIRESESSISFEGKIYPELVKKQILKQISPESVANHANEVHSILNRFCELVKSNILELAKGGWSSESVMACLDSLCEEGPPDDTWEQLIWLSHTLLCTLNSTSIMKAKKLAFLPRGFLPRNPDWGAGIERFSVISHTQTKQKATKSAKEISDDLREVWERKSAPMFYPLMLHYTRIALILEGMHRFPEIDMSVLSPISNPIPERVDDPSKYYFTMDAEVSNLQDLSLIHQGYMKILENLKKREGKFDFQDIQAMAGDLLLANCPDACRSFYPLSIQKSLDSIPEHPWLDDHIHEAFSKLKSLENDPIKAGEAASELGAIRFDLEKRFDLLKDIRRQYMAFIFDEAQDNSPVQWRLLSRLWGERRVEDDEPKIPDTPWQPTICYVGDMKQSIYSFRQAEVSGFQEYTKHLMAINEHEFHGIKELTRAPVLRRENHSRDPRYDHPSTIATASEYMEKGGSDKLPWKPFNLHERDIPLPSQTELSNRKRGLITLQMNYRTSGDLLRTMNECWEDVFSEGWRHLPEANFYAVPQNLFADPKTTGKKSGSLEWICPQNDDDRTNPPTDLDTMIDPFNSGITNTLERQAMLIALRVQSLVNGTPVRLKSANGEWYQIDAEDQVSPSDIMILLPSRIGLRDTITRHLNNLDIPYHIDNEGALFDRPAAQAIEALIQFIARPSSRHYATRVARSVLIGMDDRSLQQYIGDSDLGQDLLQRLTDYCSNEVQKTMVMRWSILSEAGRLLDILEETTDKSDLLVANPDPASRQAVEQVIEIVRDLGVEVGGDPIVIADNIRTISNSRNSPEAEPVPHGDAVKVMSIHKSKGLESKVVLIANLFSNTQTNTLHARRDRMIVSPELFAGRPKPWPDKYPHSALWNHALMVKEARTMAEARRLLYVGATRAKEKLIFAGSPINPRRTRWEENQGLWIPFNPNSEVQKGALTPTLGQMWILSMIRAHERNEYQSSPWGDGEKATLDPVRMLSNHSLAENTLKGILILHHPDCFNEQKSEAITPLQKIKQISNSDCSGKNFSKVVQDPRNDSNTRIRISPNRLPVFQDCNRRQWYETIGGLRPDPLVPDGQVYSPKGMPMGVDPATFGTIFHRILEIGIGNPGSFDNSSPALPNSWTENREDQITNPEIHSTVFRELLSPEADVDRTRLLVTKMAQVLQSGPLGRMVAGESVNDHLLEGLRTEMPFNIAIEVDTGDLVTHRWSPHGNEPLTKISQATIEMSGIIDLVMCTKTSDEEFTIRPVDLKTEDAGLVDSDSSDGLLEALDSDQIEPACIAEIEILRRYRLQMALYYRALQSIQSARMDAGLSHRKVLPPAILVGVTGRIVEYPIELLDQSLEELEDILIRTARMALSTETPLSDYDRLPIESAHICEKCPFHRGLIPICGPQDA